MCPDHWRPPEMSGFDQEAFVGLCWKGQDSLRRKVYIGSSQLQDALVHRDPLQSSMPGTG